MRKVGLVVALALVGFACADSVGKMLVDAGTSLQDGSVPDAGADFEASCNMGEANTRWSEFPVSNPGQTEVTICYAARPEQAGPSRKATCTRLVAPWYEGTNTGFIWSCDDSVTSITVHD